jgi:tRNA acetyltransferase TAN1
MVTAVQHKERSAEKEFIEHLERVADEVYPETMGVEAKDEADEDEDLEEMLKRELHGMRGEKSKRFRE